MEQENTAFNFDRWRLKLALARWRDDVGNEGSSIKKGEGTPERNSMARWLRTQRGESRNPRSN